jgi:hypothetical protein
MATHEPAHIQQLVTALGAINSPSWPSGDSDHSLKYRLSQSNSIFITQL